jgi:hypothetical protein
MTSKEKAIRDAADALRKAIEDGREAGLVVAWPHRFEELERISVSDTHKAPVTVQVNAKDLPAEVANKAAVAAQKAADKQIEKAKA